MGLCPLRGEKYLTLNHETLTLKSTRLIRLEVTMHPYLYEERKMEWSSSDETVAVVAEYENPVAGGPGRAKIRRVRPRSLYPIQKCQDSCDKMYGYRRVWRWLELQGIHRNRKTILRVMKKYGLLSEIRRRGKWVQMGQQVHKYENLLNRQFHADKPNSKWVTDISYIHTGQGVLFLSMIRDLYDNSIVAYKTATQQTVNLVLDTIRLAMRREKKKVAANLHLHSDQGFQHTCGRIAAVRRDASGGDCAQTEGKINRAHTECAPPALAGGAHFVFFLFS